MLRIATSSTALLMLFASSAFAQDIFTPVSPSPDPTHPPQVTQPVQSQVVVAQDDALLGGPGESCRARSDCRSNLRCVSNVCRDEHEGLTCSATSDCGGELRCIANVCQSAIAPTPGSGARASEPPNEWLAFRPEGVHFFAGFSLMGGPAFSVVSSNNITTNDERLRGAFLFGVRAGILAGRNEIALELSPMTFVYYENTPGPTFQFNVSYAHLLPLHEGRDASVYWPLRVGAGLFTGNTADNVYFQARADLIGIAVRVGHLMFDFHLPSFRYALSDIYLPAGFGGARNTALQHFMYWHAGASISYIF